jgi:hypothetical protein
LARLVSRRELGRYYYSIRGWLDVFATWRRGLAKKIADGQQDRSNY